MTPVNTSPPPRAQSPATRRGRPFLCGLVLGAAAYLIAESLTPQSAVSPTIHDLQLALRIGLIYPPLIGLWLGWAHRSRARMVWGLLSGFVIGLLYVGLCIVGNPSGVDFLAVMVAFPCLCGAAFALVLGVQDADRLSTAAVRLAKGLLAGTVLGVTYMITLNVGGCVVSQGMILDPMMMTPRGYIHMMWWSGPPALGLASGLFAALLQWATRPPPRTYPPGCCQTCGYNLTGNTTGICPECGLTIATRVEMGGSDE